MGDVLQAQAVAPAADEAGIWPGELDEQLISDLLSDDSLLTPLVDLADDSEHYCSRDSTGSAGAGAAPCNTTTEHERVSPAAANRAMCSAYSGPTITDIQKALSSRPHPSPSGRRYSSLYLYGGPSAAPESRHTSTVRSCGGKIPTDGYKWRKYGQKSTKNNAHPRSYYKCTSSRCGAKKHVEKSTDDPEMFTVTYEGLHLHGPQPLSRHLQPSAPTRTDVLYEQAMVNKKARLSPSSDDDHGDCGAGVGCGARPSKETCREDHDVRGGGGSKLQGRQKGRAHDAVQGVIAADSCDGWSTASSVPRPDDAAAVFSSESPPAANWPCLDLPWSPDEADHFPWTI